MNILITTQQLATKYLVGECKQISERSITTGDKTFSIRKFPSPKQIEE